MAKRKRYSMAMRAKVLAAAKVEGLTAKDVQKKFGVIPVTYYSWRKKSSGGAGGAVRASLGRNSSNLAETVRGQVQAKVRELLPGVVRSEVSTYLDSLFGKRRGTRKL
jgi:transposase-like protein